LSRYGNHMQWVEFHKKMSAFPVFSLQDINKNISGFSYRQLDRWEKKGFLYKIKRGFYCLTNQIPTEQFLYFTANKIYDPSYISLEKALKYYSLIPEEIFQMTSVSTRKTAQFETVVGHFSYRHIKPGLFWGYCLLDQDQHKFLVAEPEKAILDYLYLKPQIKTVVDFRELRINVDSFNEQIDTDKLEKYLQAFNSKALIVRTKKFLASLSHD
jgi:predicted transcriptional regulator of viral defense system